MGARIICKAIGAMDNPVSGDYFDHMFARVVTLFAVIGIALVTMLSSAHAARMGAAPDHAVHLAEMMQATSGGEASCDSDKHCGSGDAGMCEFVCTGVLFFLPSPGSGVVEARATAMHGVLSNELHTSQAPGLKERPPRSRLL